MYEDKIKAVKAKGCRSFVHGVWLPGRRQNQPKIEHRYVVNYNAAGSLYSSCCVLGQLVYWVF
jgi:hypothetical protein